MVWPEALWGYLTHKKTQPPRTLPQAYALGPRGVLEGVGRFLMGEVPLYLIAVDS